MLSDDDLIFGLANNIISHRKRNIAMFKTEFYTRDLSREDIVEWGKKKLAPLLSSAEEIIPRDQWDLLGLKGATDKQLLHPHYVIMRDYFLSGNYQPKHDTAVLMLCANKKPYRGNFLINRFYNLSKDTADFYILSNPGVIPIEYDNHYPFRWYEWNELEETPEIKQLYTEELQKRIETWFNHFNGYKRVVSVIRPGETHTAYLQSNIPQQKDDVFSQHNMELLEQEYLIPVFKNNRGLFKTRLLNLKRVKEIFINTLQGKETI